jgi:type VI secretion system secreted protein VgrG
MATYVQADRPVVVSTPLGQDVLILVGFNGHEAISQLFTYQLDLLAENKQEIAFDKLLGQKISVTLTLPGNDKKGYISGICKTVTQGVRRHTFTSYRVEIVPRFWMLTRNAQSRIFQHISVPDILKKVLEGLDVSYQIQGSFNPRDFCVQYRESDFNFASRLMEEEGIFYFFTHTADGHKLVLANTPQAHPAMPEESELIYEEVEGGEREEDRVHDWEKVQELRSGKYTLWDHCFELPHKNLEAEEPILDSVTVGAVTHKLKVGNNDKLEIYDYPGAYAQRFDGIDRGGGDQSGDLQKIYQDNRRTTKIRMEQETVSGLVIKGGSNCRQLVAGHKFTLARHFNADGQYLMTGLRQSARLSGEYRSGEEEFEYDNSFSAIPFAIPFRPRQVTPKPVVQGTQTAIVVGPQGEEIFVDKYGRVKVQFLWDRNSSADADSSCWIRVATPWAGKKWGVIHTPRIGMEVVVDFLEGDPDQPIIVGSVYNAEMMPPYKLPDEKTKSTTKTMSTVGGGGFNEIRFEDKKGKEQVFIHGEKDLDIRIKNESREWIGEDRHLIVKRDKIEEVDRDKHIVIKRDQIEEIDRDQHFTVKGKAATQVVGSNSIEVQGDVIEVFKSNHSEEVTSSYYLKAKNVVIEGMIGLTIKVGGNFVNINASGIQIVGTMVMINSGGSALSGSAGSLVSPIVPLVAVVADDASPGALAEIYKTKAAAAGAGPGGGADQASHDPNSDANKEKTSWIEIKLVDEADKPVPGEPYQVTLADGTTVASGTLDDKGFARIDHIDPGQCKVTFPNLDKEAWEEA